MMKTSEIRQCICLTKAFRIQDVQLNMKQKRIFMPLEVDWIEPAKLEWLPSLSGKLLQLVLFPIVLFGSLATGIIVDIYERLALRVRFVLLWFVAIAYKLKIIKHSPPPSNTLWSLWQMYGIERGCWDDELMCTLLNNWVVLLYGHGVMSQKEILNSLLETRKAQYEANLSYYKGDPDAAHFFLPLLSKA